MKTKWDILDLNILKSLLEMDKSQKNFHLWWKAEIDFCLCFTRGEKASGNISKKLQKKWNSCFCMQLLLRYEYLAAKRQLSGSPVLMNIYLKTKECWFVELLCCADAIAVLHTDAFPFYSWENFAKNYWKVKPKIRWKRSNQFLWFTSFNVKNHTVSVKDL